MGISPGLRNDCKAIAVNRLCVPSGILYFHNSCTLLKPIHRHLVSYFTTNPTWFKGSSPRISIATRDMLAWQDNCRRPKKNILWMSTDEIQHHLMDWNNKFYVHLTLTVVFNILQKGVESAFSRFQNCVKIAGVCVEI